MQISRWGHLWQPLLQIKTFKWMCQQKVEFIVAGQFIERCHHHHYQQHLHGDIHEQPNFEAHTHSDTHVKSAIGTKSWNIPRNSFVVKQTMKILATPVNEIDGTQSLTGGSSLKLFVQMSSRTTIPCCSLQKIRFCRFKIRVIYFNLLRLWPAFISESSMIFD